MAAINWALLFLLGLVSWLGMAYGIHRLAHYPKKWNCLYQWHKAHHSPAYFNKLNEFNWNRLIFCFGSVPETLDIWITLTLPLLLVTLFLPRQGLALLGFHYVYEILFSDQRLDHNPNIKGTITQMFAWGEYHLKHHADPRHNFGLVITLWDRVFATVGQSVIRGEG
jgi:sterol desaturase/sphingolipid hydroxylase (fatty acid hydroxylase superfamily)